MCTFRLNICYKDFFIESLNLILAFSQWLHLSQVRQGKRQAESLRLLVAPFLLRRLKKEVTLPALEGAAGSAFGDGRVARLPPKTEQVSQGAPFNKLKSILKKN